MWLAMRNAVSQPHSQTPVFSLSLNAQHFRNKCYCWLVHLGLGGKAPSSVVGKKVVWIWSGLAPPPWFSILQPCKGTSTEVFASLCWLPIYSHNCGAASMCLVCFPQAGFSYTFCQHYVERSWSNFNSPSVDRLQWLLSFALFSSTFPRQKYNSISRRWTEVGQRSLTFPQLKFLEINSCPTASDAMGISKKDWSCLTAIACSAVPWSYLLLCSDTLRGWWAGSEPMP